MTTFFADTWYWLALLNIDDAHHETVASAEVKGVLVTTWAVQIEVLDALSSQRFRPLAIAFWNVCQLEEVRVVELDRNLLEAAMDLFSRRPDKNWSFTD